MKMTPRTVDNSGKWQSLGSGTGREQGLGRDTVLMS